MSTQEIRFSGFGGQGIIRCALITGKALSLYDDKFATMTQAFGLRRAAALVPRNSCFRRSCSVSLHHTPRNSDGAVAGSL